jgi:hypothetical protein
MKQIILSKKMQKSGELALILRSLKNNLNESLVALNYSNMIYHIKEFNNLKIKISNEESKKSSTKTEWEVIIDEDLMEIKEIIDFSNNILNNRRKLNLQSNRLANYLSSDFNYEN